MYSLLFNPVVVIAIIVVMALFSAIKILKEYERGVIFRLGRLVQARGPGLIIVIPVLEKMVRISLRLITMDVPPQDIITRDNVSVKVNAVVYFRVMDSSKAVVEVEDFFYATSQLAQTTLRSVLGQVELDDLLAEREKINHDLQEILDSATDAAHDLALQTNQQLFWNDHNGLLLGSYHPGYEEDQKLRSEDLKQLEEEPQSAARLSC